MSRFRKGKKAARKFDFWLEFFGIRNHSPMSTKQRKLVNRYVTFHNNRLDNTIGEVISKNYLKDEKITRDGSLQIVGEWEDDLIWCPSQCYLKIVHRNRWFIIYLRWRWSDPWKAYLCETAVGNVDPGNPPGWDMHDPGYEWITIPVDDFIDKQLDQLKIAVMEEVKRLLPKI